MHVPVSLPSDLPRTRVELAAIIDHTLLRPEATENVVREHCREADELLVYSVCVSASMVPTAADELQGTGVRVTAVVGFPSGAHRSHIKAREAEMAVADGAHELDMVINLALVRTGDWDRVRADIAGVRAATPAATLKVIIEAGALGHDGIVGACRAAEDVGAQFVKTSTGFHPAGGATTGQVRLMAKTVGNRLGVKASGGIRSAEAALSMVRAEAARLGLSGTRAVLAELPAD